MSNARKSSGLMRNMLVIFFVLVASTTTVRGSEDTDPYNNNKVIQEVCPAIIMRDSTISIDDCLYTLSAGPETTGADSIASLGLGSIQYVKGHLEFTVSIFSRQGTGGVQQLQDCAKLFSDVVPTLQDVEADYSARKLQAVDHKFNVVAAAADSCTQGFNDDVKIPFWLSEETHIISLVSKIIHGIVQIV